MKEYFSHDYHARNGRKLRNVFMKYGLEGIGAYWCIVEQLYEEDGFLPLAECERIAFELRTHSDIIISIISDFELFEKENEKFYSPSALERLKLRKLKSDKAKISASTRWNHANASRTQSDGNAIKVKKSKLNKIKKKSLKKIFQEDSEAMILARELLVGILKNNPLAKQPNLQSWAEDFDLLLRVDERPFDVSSFLIQWSQSNDFWKGNILSASKFREKFDQLFIKAKVDFEKSTKNQIVSV